MKDTRTIATGGICLAMATVSLYFASFVPGAELTLYALASVFVAVMVDEKGLGGGALVYVGACLLGFLLVPGKIGILPFVFFFGIYPLIKFYAERVPGRVAQFSIKIVLFLLVFGVTLLFFKELFFPSNDFHGIPPVLVVILGVIPFLAYDYVMTAVIKIYRRKIKRQKDDFKLS